MHQIRNLVDYAIELESFAGSDKEANPIFKEYHGLFYVRKSAALATLASNLPTNPDLAFKLKRKQFFIEKLHLPPEFGETEPKTNEDLMSSIGCGSTAKPLLDF